MFNTRIDWLVDSDRIKEVSFAKVFLSTDDDNSEVILSGTGVSRCVAPDKFDQELGEQLAVGRALRDLGRQLINDAQEVVSLRDEARERQLEASEAALATKEAKTQKFLEDFALLINEKLESEKPLDENDIQTRRYLPA